jgi:hypothetical protein
MYPQQDNNIINFLKKYLELEVWLKWQAQGPEFKPQYCKTTITKQEIKQQNP